MCSAAPDVPQFADEHARRVAASSAIRALYVPVFAGLLASALHFESAPEVPRTPVPA